MNNPNQPPQPSESNIDFIQPATSKNQSPISRKKFTSKTIFAGLGALLALIMLAVVLLAWQYNQAINQPKEPSGAQVQFTIEPGATTDQIAKILIDRQLLKDDFYFKLYLRLNPSKAAMQAGDFSIPQTISIQQLVDRLSLASRQQAIITFPEGLRREEMVEIVDRQYQQGNIAFTAEQFSELALNPSATLRSKLGSRLPADASLQGYLFPDTYHIDRDATAEDLIVKMLENYLSKVTPTIQSGIANQELTEYQALILAAIVERESYAGDERPVIGFIMLERLRTGEILGVDATLQYALGYSESEKRWWRQAITMDDLNLDSPYNTRRRTGMPPTPIANPGIEAIKAIAMPQTTPYLYYLHDSEGKIYYARTLQEHNANVAQYLQ